jgi:hypothetical protein
MERKSNARRALFPRPSLRVHHLLGRLKLLNTRSIAVSAISRQAILLVLSKKVVIRQSEESREREKERKKAARQNLPWSATQQSLVRTFSLLDG